MKKVINTKSYSVKQMENMAYNLRKKFKVYCSIDYRVTTNAHVCIPNTQLKEIDTMKKFYFYIDGVFHHCGSWQKVQQEYYELMKGE